LKPVALMFSGGKDSLAALAALGGRDDLRVEWLVTTCNETNARIALHGTPFALLAAQADALGLPLLRIDLPEACDNATYIARVADGLSGPRADGLAAIAFGDLFLEDIRAFRERQFAGTGLDTLFPLWGRNTSELACTLIDAGYRAVVCGIDREALSETLLGRVWDRALLDELPAGVDPCGENGEFHTFVCDAPEMARPVAVKPGRMHVSHDRFCMLDLQPA